MTAQSQHVAKPEHRHAGRKESDHQHPLNYEDPNRMTMTSPETVMRLQSTIGNQAVQRLIHRSPADHTAPAHRKIQRDQLVKDPVTKSPPQVGDGTANLDANEAASLVELRLFDSDGYFAAVRQEIDRFKDDIKTELGWYAGDKKQKDEVPSPTPVKDFGIAQAKEKASDLAKTMFSTLITGFSGGVIGSSPAGTAAGVMVSILKDILDDDYSPVVVKAALKPAHQLYVESLMSIVSQQQTDLRNKWTRGRTEAIKQDGIEGLKRHADRIAQATAQVRQRLYVDMTAAYLSYAPDRSVELETPHSKYTGKKQGNIDFFGYGAGAHFASKISSGEIYVEIDNSRGSHTSSMRVKKTVLPQLPSGVLAQLNDPDMTKGMSLGTRSLPYKRVIMESGNSNFPARIVFNGEASQLEIAETPHFSKMFCQEIARAHGNNTNETLLGQRFSTGELTGASLLWSWLATLPLHELHFSA